MLTVAFYALYGPVDVAVPVHVARDLHAPASLLAVFVTVFGFGALLGGLASAWTARIPPAPLTTGVVIGWGVCLLPLGLGAPQWLGLAAFGVGAFLYAPHLTASTVLLQRATPRPLLPRVLALRTSMVNFAVPLGAVLAGPLLVDVGARRVILASALATVALGVLAAAVTATVLLRPTGRNPAATPRPADDDGPPAHDPDDLPGRDRA